MSVHYSVKEVTGPAGDADHPAECPNCGFRPGAADFATGLSRRGLSGMERDVLERLVAARGAPVTLRRLIDAVYGDDEDGGPVSADTNIRIYVRKLDRKLTPRGFRVVSDGYGIGWCLRAIKARGGAR